MNNKLYTDGEIPELRSLPKQITNPRAHWSEKPKERPAYRQRTFQVSGQQDEEMRFSVYQRENLNDNSDFSCGILYLATVRPRCGEGNQPFGGRGDEGVSGVKIPSPRQVFGNPTGHWAFLTQSSEEA